MTIEYKDSKRIITYPTEYKVHTFTTTGNSTFAVTGSGDVEYLVVAGGGGGGSRRAGGGGAGGYLTNVGGTTHAVTAQSYTITVGAGGAGGVGHPVGGTSGGNSVFDTITSTGGGGGSVGDSGGSGLAGGSGGGGNTGGAGTSGQGFNGGNSNTAENYAGGGGGGSGGLGGNATGASPSDVGGAGGVGTANSISGSSITYAGGGGGGVYVLNTVGTVDTISGAGLGGDGLAGSDASVNSGSGGGGGGLGGTPTFTSYNGGSGGSGIVIIRYVDDGSITATGGTITTVTGGEQSKPTNVQDNSILVEKDTGRRYWFDAESARTPTFEDDMTSDNWTSNHVNLAYNATDDDFDITMETATGFSNRVAYLDNGSVISDEKWVCEFDMDITAYTEDTSGTANVRMWIGMSDNTDHTEVNNDFIGVYFNMINTNDSSASATDMLATAPWSATAENEVDDIVAVQKVWFRITRQSTIAYLVEYFSDSARTVSLGSSVGVTTSGVADLRYFKIVPYATSSNNGNFSATLDNVKIYNGVTSVTAPATWTGNFDLTGLKAYWKFDEASGDIINQATAVGSTDSLGSAADGQVSGADYGAAGILGTALTWVDGTADKVTIGSSTTQWKFMSGTSMLFTLILWVKQTNLSSGQEALFMETDFDHNNQGFGLELRASRALNIGIGNAAVSHTSATNFMPSIDGNWHMLMISGNQALGTQMAYSIDDGTPVTFALTGTLSNTAATNVMEIGNSGGTYPLEYDGSIDELSVWNRVLTPAEITTLYNARKGKAVY